MKSVFCAVLLIATCPVAALAQTADELLNAEKTPQNVLTYGMSYSQQRFSPLTQINRDTVKRLGPAWSYSMNNSTGEESQALVYNGVIYITGQNKTVAVDALTGKEIWNTPVEYPPETTTVVCCGAVNRGAAIYEGRVFRTTLDAHVIALDMKTGKVIWNVKSGDTKDGIAMTGAPIVADGVLINGMAGAEYGSRGYIEGYDPNTGNRLWRHYTVPRPGEPGADTWLDNASNASGGSTWTTGTYDPGLDLVFWGTGNPAPHNALLRKGDNLFTDSILAIRPKTGEVVWYLQMSPDDPFDHDNAESLIVATLNINGKPTKVLLEAARNGFYYVIEAKTGQLIAANPYVKVTWATGIDLKTGRPQWTDTTKKAATSTEEIETWPAVAGGTNWYPPSFDPRTRTAYVNTTDYGMKYWADPVDMIKNLKLGEPQRATHETRIFNADGIRGHLRAIDPMTGKSKWSIGFKSPNWAGTLVTAGGLVFTGELTGEFIAVDSDTGKILWKFQTPSGIVGQPVTWEHDGKQYVTVTSGIGGSYVLKTPDPNLKHVPPGGTLWTFALFDAAATANATDKGAAAAAPDNGADKGATTAEPDNGADKGAAAAAANNNGVDKGAAVYAKHCATCHGDDLQNNSGVAFDLRRLRADEHERFVNSVLRGKNNMPPFQGRVTKEQIEELWAYIRAHAYQQ
jgi:alcohol dehydrogenase (cytochrome c)